MWLPISVIPNNNSNMKHVVRYLQSHFCNSIKNAVRNYWITQWVMIMKIQDSTLPFPVKISKTIQTKRTRWKIDIHSEGRLLSSGSVPSIALIQPAHQFLHGSHWMSPTLYNGPRNAFKIALPLTEDLGSHLIHGFLGPRKSTTQTACRSDQRIISRLTQRTMWSTDRLTDHAKL